MTDKEKMFFDIFNKWLNHNGYSYENAAARLKCEPKHISWMKMRKMIPKNEIILKWLPTLLEGFNGDILNVYKTFQEG